MGKILIVSVVTAVVLIETAVALILIPSGDEVAEQVRQDIQNEWREERGDADLLEKGEEEDVELVEVDLGAFDITIHDNKAQSTYAVDCKVVGTIKKEEKSDFDTLYENNKNRVREKIMVEFRSAKVEELAESELGLIKQRISENINQLFRKTLLREVFLPEFNYYQQ